MNMRTKILGVVAFAGSLSVAPVEEGCLPANSPVVQGILEAKDLACIDAEILLGVKDPKIVQVFCNIPDSSFTSMTNEMSKQQAALETAASIKSGTYNAKDAGDQ